MAEVVQTATALATRVTYDSDNPDPDDTYVIASYLRFALPNLGGAVPIKATLYIYQDLGSTSNCACAGRYCADAGAWDNATGQAALDALAVGTNLGVFTIDKAANEWETLDILGDSTKGIKKIYSDDSAPDPCTVKLHYTSSEAADSVGTGTELGAEGEHSDAVEFQVPGEANEPYIELEYIPVGGSQGSILQRLILGI